MIATTQHFQTCRKRRKRRRRRRRRGKDHFPSFLFPPPLDLRKKVKTASSALHGRRTLLPSPLPSPLPSLPSPLPSLLPGTFFKKRERAAAPSHMCECVPPLSSLPPFLCRRRRRRWDSRETGGFWGLLCCGKEVFFGQSTPQSYDVL